MKKILFCLLLLAGYVSHAQVFNNEWIDYNKTYYRFKVPANGLYRIPFATLNNIGLAATPAEHFQLWRNGVQIPIYTSVASGAFSSSDYIEFWGEMNDGKPDKALYRDPNFQLNDKWSLMTDTAIYFLTVNPSTNRRLLPTANNVVGNTIPAEPYFLHTEGKYFKDRINNGRAENVGEYLFSSSYDIGEGYSSPEIGANATQTTSLTNLFPYTGVAPAPIFKISLSGNTTTLRRYRATINGDSISGNTIDYFKDRTDIVNVPMSLIASGNATVAITNITSAPIDRMVVHKYELTYPRIFNFNGAASFEFRLAPSINPQYLEITNFNHSNIPPVLYDLTNGRRYVADISNPSIVKIVIESSSIERRLVLVNEAGVGMRSVTSITQKTFTNFTLTANQGDYLIISHPLLFNGPGGIDPVEQYRQYRSSSNGGSYNAKIITASELYEQFAFGIKNNPLAIRNFVLYARANFAQTPKHVFIIGKGVHYANNRFYEGNPDFDKLNLVPTWGWPASDVMLSAEPGSSQPTVPVGRLSVVTPTEVLDYLQKVKDYETAQRTTSPLIADKAWMKNVVHAVGVTEPGLLIAIDNYMAYYSRVISDTAFGGKVTTFTKSSPDAIQQANNGELNRLFAEGISLFTYFGHSASTLLEFNLNNPDQYNNTGKYPMFVALGCNAGNSFNANFSRLVSKETLSETFVLAQNKGTIGFIASSHFGLPEYLDIYTARMYESIGYKDYGKTIGEIMKNSIKGVFDFTTQEDFYARATCEETNLNGDPAIRINSFPKPDYVIEEQLLSIKPTFVSVADASFTVKAKTLNIGKAIDRAITFRVKRTYPNGTEEIVASKRIPRLLYSDSIIVELPIDPIRDKGKNIITVEVDADNEVDELFETNNSFSKELIVIEDDARPVYPYNFSIVNKRNTKFVVSTANPFAAVKEYKIEIDTTEKFNSPIKYSATKSFGGGILEFEPSITYIDSTVYYWRVTATGGIAEAATTASFIFIDAGPTGFNQSHYFQHTKSAFKRMYLDSTSRMFEFNEVNNELYIRNGVWGTATGQAGDLVVNVNSQSFIRNTCNYGIIFNVFDGKTFKPWENRNVGSTGLYESLPYCNSAPRRFNFEYRNDSAGRRKALNFLRQVPTGHYIVVRNQPLSDSMSNEYADKWKADESIYGVGNSLYSELKNNGFTLLDSFTRPRAYAFVYKKNTPAFPGHQVISEGKFDVISMSVIAPTRDSTGSITSPLVGPATTWTELRWSGHSVDAVNTDRTKFSLVGVKLSGATDTLISDVTAPVTDISFINPAVYPYLKLHLKVSDTVNFSPYQLNYWRVTYVPKAEGAVAPNILFSMPDTLEAGQPFEFKMVFKNVSDIGFDSLKVKVTVTDKNNVAHDIPVPKLKPLALNDTAHVHFTLDSKLYEGLNTLFVNVNPDQDQPEQYYFNNFILRNFFVYSDSLDPLLDVTFDNTHILNGDIVSAKPLIVIQLKDEAKFRLLDDSSLVQVQVRFPDMSVRTFHYNSDTLQFVPATSATGTGNMATVNFRPYFNQDGKYQLIVKATDKSNNEAGKMGYVVEFEVFNKPMISNMLNYPNPFTTSTAFVFTITGSEVPQNIRIQILTVTGKVVKEITKDELGPLHIGRNITEYKWDGTDMYGQRLGNGVYLYRVITNNNGKSLDKFERDSNPTDKYFNKGYGKMYLMR